MKRAEAPRAPKAGAGVVRAAEERRVLLAAREALERRSLVRGLMVLAVVVLVFSVARAGWGRAFVPGWWKQW